MKKIDIGKNVFVFPMPMVLVGTQVQGKANFMAVGWVSRVNAVPPLIAVALNKRHYTLEGIEQNGTFSINTPDIALLEKTDYCGLVSGRKHDKSQIFEIFFGELQTAPMIRNCPLSIECNLFEMVPLPSNKVVIGEIVAAYSDERYMSNGKLDILKISPFLLTMPDNNYWRVGEKLAKAWNVGLNYKAEAELT